MISMLKQNINLLQKEDNLEPRLSLKRISLIWLAIALFYSIYGGWLYISYHQLINANAQIKALQESAQNKMQLLSEVKHQEISISLPLSTYLEGIKLGSVPGTTLSEFYLESTGKNVHFSGQAQDVTLLPQLLTSWQQGKKLRNQIIGNIQIEKLDANNKAVKFSFEANN